jgi:hypothetical protein
MLHREVVRRRPLRKWIAAVPLGLGVSFIYVWTVGALRQPPVVHASIVS